MGRLSIGATDRRNIATIQAIINSHRLAQQTTMPVEAFAPLAVPIVGVIDGPQAAVRADCGECDEPLVTGRDIETGYHTARDGAYSCYDRAQENADLPGRRFS